MKDLQTGECLRVAEEHLWPSTVEELNELLSRRVAKEDLDRLLRNDPDDPDVFEPENENEKDLDMEDYEPCILNDQDFEFKFPAGDTEMLDADIDKDLLPPETQDAEPSGEYGPEEDPWKTMWRKERLLGDDAEASTERTREGIALVTYSSH